MNVDLAFNIWLSGLWIFLFIQGMIRNEIVNYNQTNTIGIMIKEKFINLIAIARE